MKELLTKTQAYRLLKKECAENACSHAYLLLFNDAKNLRSALKTFAKLLFCSHEGERNERREKFVRLFILSGGWEKIDRGRCGKNTRRKFIKPY